MDVHTFENGQVIILNTTEAMTLNEILNDRLERPHPPRLTRMLADKLYNREWSGR